MKYKYSISSLNDEQHNILNDLVNNKHTDLKNTSEALRTCIKFNTIVLMGGV